MAVTEDEKRLIERSRQGDADAFASLLQKYQQMIHALTFRMTGSMADADDLTQETFVQAFRQLANFRGDSAFSSWLYRIAVNKSLNHRKRDINRERLHAEWAAEQSIASATAPNARLSAGVQEALLKLDPKQRAAVVLTTYDGLNHAEAARALGCSETTVSWRIFAARRKLKSWLKVLKAEADHE